MATTTENLDYLRSMATGPNARLALTDSGVAAYYREIVPCGHEDCAAHPELAESCTPGRVRYVATAFVGRSAKPALDYYYTSPAARASAVGRLVSGRRAHEERKAQRKAAERAPLAQPVKVGDIFAASWGYDQTNVDFYEVIAIRGTCTVDIVKIGNADAGTDRVTADRLLRGNVYTGKRVRNCGGDARITIDDVRSAGRWDGRPMYETNAYAGH